MKRKIVAGLVAAGASLTIAAGPAAAAPAPSIPSIPPQLLDTLFGSLSGNAPTPPSKPSPNGVASISVQVKSWFGGYDLGPSLYKTGMRPHVIWSARDRSNAEVKGKNCQTEIQFPGTDFPTYKTAQCQGSVGFNGDTTRYRTPGKYSIVVVDRVSGASKSVSFTIE